MMNTGSLRLAKPSMGSWAVYGLGTQNQNMPGFVSLRPGSGIPPGGTQNWQSAFLPGVFQGTSVNTQVNSVEEMIQNIRNPYVSVGEQRRQLDLIHELNEIHAQNLQKDAQLEARIEAYEIAFKMQSEATDVFDYTKEPQAIKELYGNSPQGRQLLIARRLVERGVRFVQVWAGGWDHHNDIQTRLPEKAKEIDQPLAALLTDLKQRGMLEDTLVIWGGEFGRTVTKDRNGNDKPGRDHNSKGFSMWMAGGGVKGGTIHGATDEFGAHAIENKVHIHDLHATVLKLLGFDHTKLTYRYNGRDFRLTDVAGEIVNGIIA
jgi:membrane-anchored protein YejM (alkaline phosphatase superfamily)